MSNIIFWACCRNQELLEWRVFEGKMPIITVEISIKAPIETVFDLARNIDFHVRTQTRHKERAVGDLTGGLIGPDQSVTWEAIHFGIRQRLTSKITEFDRSYRFVDEITQGAFTSFRHLHEFIPIGDSTKMMDVFAYKSPLWVLGIVADKLFLETYMRKVLRDRAILIKQEAEQ